MTKESLRTEMLAGIITETQYREECEKLTLTESKTSNKKSLNENISYPDVISGNSTPKKDYEMAFEHFIGSKLNENEDEINEEGPKVNEEAWEIYRFAEKFFPNLEDNKALTNALETAARISTTRGGLVYNR